MYESMSLRKQSNFTLLVYLEQYSYFKYERRRVFKEHHKLGVHIQQLVLLLLQQLLEEALEHVQLDDVLSHLLHGWEVHGIDVLLHTQHAGNNGYYSLRARVLGNSKLNRAQSISKCADNVEE